jgi:hypothetical protein
MSFHKILILIQILCNLGILICALRILYLQKSIESLKKSNDADNNCNSTKN